MSYADWAQPKQWTVKNSYPAPNASCFGLQQGDVLQFTGNGTASPSCKILRNGVEWGSGCLFSNGGGLEKVQGTHKASGQTFSITRTVPTGGGLPTLVGDVIALTPAYTETPPAVTETESFGGPVIDDGPEEGPGDGSGSGSWTAEDGGTP